MAKKRNRATNRTRPQAPPLDVNARYTLEESLAYLKFSRALLYCRVQAGLLRITKDGKRAYLHGSEIARYLAQPSVAA